MNFISLFKTSRTVLFAILTLIASRQMMVASGTDQQKLVSANTDFAFDLMGQVTQGQREANVFISPFSVSSALQMVENGAAGQTKTEMQQVLKTTNLPSAALNESFKELNQSLVSRKDVTLNLANGIWLKQGFHLMPAFVADNKNFFQAELAGVDFDNPSSAHTINNWAEKQTQGRIKDIVQYPFDPYMRVILANAIYFKGKWITPFDKSQTKPRDFHLSSGKVKSAPMMVQNRKFDYQETPDFQTVQLFYEGNLRMGVYLPAKNSSPQKLIESFKTRGNWQNNIQPGFRERKGTLMLPKFKMEYAVRLNKPLETLGMKRAFSIIAEFSAMAKEQLFISEVKQKSFVEVDEKGTEAAAVTGISVVATGIEMQPPKPFEMIVNRPFLFVISDNATDSILFIGIVNDPTTSGAN
jgi:serine protease inhibitor